MSAYWNMWRYGYSFSGRTTRRNYFKALTTHFILMLLMMFSVAIISVIVCGDSSRAVWIAQLVCGAYGVASLVPCIAITVRRLNDAGYTAGSFWWLLIPVLGGVALIARLCGKSIENE